MRERKTSPSEKDCKRRPVILTKVDPSDGFDPRSWTEFWQTGLPGMLNTILGVFGWVIVADADENGNIINVYPARTLYRGCDESAQSRWYERVGQYMVKNADTIYSEAFENTSLLNTVEIVKPENEKPVIVRDDTIKNPNLANNAATEKILLQELKGIGIIGEDVNGKVREIDDLPIP